MVDIMEFIHPAVPARRATLNQQKQNALFIYWYSLFVLAVVIFLHLFMSGDVELDPGPQGEHYFYQPRTLQSLYDY